MKCLVDGLPIAIERITYRDLGYGTDPGREVFPFKIVVTKDELIDVFGESFDEFVSECVEDDKILDEPDIPKLKEIGYPSLDIMMSLHSEMLAKLIPQYLYFNVLDCLLKESVGKDWWFAINKLVSVGVDGDIWRFEGVGYRLRLWP